MCLPAQLALFLGCPVEVSLWPSRQCLRLCDAWAAPLEQRKIPHGHEDEARLTAVIVELAGSTAGLRPKIFEPRRPLCRVPHWPARSRMLRMRWARTRGNDGQTRIQLPVRRPNFCSCVD